MRTSWRAPNGPARLVAAFSFFTVTASLTLLVGCSGSGGNNARRAGPSASTSASVPPSTPTTAVGVIYRVKRGDTLTSIARRFRVPATTIRSTNHIANPDRLVEGQRLTIPPRPPLKFVVSPSGGPPGQSFELRVSGAQPGESIRFRVESPKGKFMGPPHAADAAGTVTAGYQTSITDPAGPYRALAHGNQGTDARAEFVVVATTPTT